ncbi:MAG: GAF domain-containing protein [Bacteroidetes bacterium]|nr:GAF domain-containing protein [Bacteroidota bacterium]MBU1114847.1 GAF domain-containing protein [Bacteroidota bacterium]MBU1797566.1 GAF domain-containing protein [Bacteroidota bacterium]
MQVAIDLNKSEVEIYEECFVILEHLIISSDKIISNLSNYIALMKQAFSKISWIGFYIRENDKLFLGPFQGKTACTEILIGNGVCGTSAHIRETIIVNNVNEFAGHIACDSSSKSEIVIPIIINEQVWGVLDIDSSAIGSFSTMDKNYLEKQIELLTKKLNLDEFVLQ